MSNVEKAKAELSKVDFEALIQSVCKDFVDACIDEGLSVEKTRQLLVSSEGLDLIAELAAKRI
jgi:hypothetical protein